MVGVRLCSEPDCSKAHLAKGLCKTHYSRLKKPLKVWPTVSERFWARITPGEVDECWPWPKVDPKGYGYFTSEKGSESVHRFSYRDTHGEIPKGLQVDHKCRNRACVNPSHLQLATGSQNSQNVATSGRAGSSQYRGVDWHKRSGRWRARVQVDNKPISVGFFDSEIEAANAALAKRLELQTNNLEDQKFKESGIV